MEHAALLWYSISVEKNRVYLYLHKRIATCTFKVHWYIPFRKNWRFCQYWIDCIMIPSTSVSVNRFLSANVMPDYFLYKNIHIYTSNIKPIKQWMLILAFHDYWLHVCLKSNSFNFLNEFYLVKFLLKNLIVSR